MGIFSRKTAPAGASEAKRGIDTVIGVDAVFEGNLHIKNSICIEGTLRGKLRCDGRVILNASGVLEADVSATYLSVNGKVLGNVRAEKQLDVGETGVIEGDVEAAAITVAKGGVLRGSCSTVGEGVSDAVAQARPVPVRSKAVPAPAGPVRKRVQGADPELVPS